MAQYGDLFPGTRPTSTSCSSSWPGGWRRPRRCGDSLSPEQREQLQSLANSLFEDMDLRWQMERLAANLRAPSPTRAGGQSYGFRGEGPLGFADATDVASQLGDLDRMEESSRLGHPADALPEIDLEQCGATSATTRRARSTGWPA